MKELYLAVTWLLKKFVVFQALRCSFWVRFSKMYFHRRAGKRTPNIVKSQNVRILSIVQWFYPFPYANSMQQTSPIHLNTSPTSFEGPGNGKHENATQHLKNKLKLVRKLARFLKHICQTHTLNHLYRKCFNSLVDPPTCFLYVRFCGSRARRGPHNWHRPWAPARCLTMVCR